MLSTLGSSFTRKGAPHLIISGALHYFRIHPGLWEDRLRRLVAMGLNTVETYVPWNYHAVAPNHVDFSGSRDLARFLDLAAAADLDIIVRPGPYICAEWDNGGLPAWVHRDPGAKIRCSDPQYLKAVDEWFDHLTPIIASRQTSCGGRIVMVQVENEYGSYGQDKAYLAHLRDGLIARGIDSLLVTSDGPGRLWLEAGTIDGTIPTINFGSRSAQYLAAFREDYPEQPAMCMEYWNGWFDHWGEPHHQRDVESAAAELETALAADMSCNLYMAHGGTNFGLWNGANYDQYVRPTITSYDYDAPIAENGALTAKFFAFREVIGKYRKLPELPQDLLQSPPTVTARPLPATTTGVLTCDALESLSRRVCHAVPGVTYQDSPSPFPPTFEALGLERGMLLLRSSTIFPGETQRLRLMGLRDRAHIFFDGQFVGIADHECSEFDVTAPRGRVSIDLIVESIGRINYGYLLGQAKGITQGVWCGTSYVMGWQAFPLPLDQISPNELISSSAQTGVGLRLSSYELCLADSEIGLDAFVDCGTSGRGMVWAQDFLLGRYDGRGPQRTLYAPSPVLESLTTFTVLATDGSPPQLQLSDTHLLDETERSSAEGEK